MLAKLIPVVNFITILCSHYLYKSAFRTAQLSLLMFQFCNFWRQNIGAKFLSKMYAKLIPGDDAIKKFTPSLGICLFWSLDS